MSARCACRFGRDHDGSEFGPCECCEREADKDREDAAILRDAARWRVSQVVYPGRGFAERCGFFSVRHDDGYKVGIQPHPLTGSLGLNYCTMGAGRDKASAIDGMFLSLDKYVEEGVLLEPQLEAIRVLAAKAGGRP